MTADPTTIAPLRANSESPYTPVGRLLIALHNANGLAFLASAPMKPGDTDHDEWMARQAEKSRGEFVAAWRAGECPEYLQRTEAYRVLAGVAEQLPRAEDGTTTWKTAWLRLRREGMPGADWQNLEAELKELLRLEEEPVAATIEARTTAEDAARGQPSTKGGAPAAGSTAGPLPPDRFCWHGRVAEDLETKQYRLLAALWGENGPLAPVPVTGVIEVVYDSCPPAGHGLDQCVEALKQLRRRTQKCLNASGVRLVIDWHAKKLSLRATDRD